MRILAIESSCDETAAAVVEDGVRLLSSVVASQVDLHAQYGGVFPEMASRAHIEAIYPVIESALREAELGLAEIDALAVTQGPGLPGSLAVGVNAAKGLAIGSGLPLIGMNHIEGHVYSLWLSGPGYRFLPDGSPDPDEAPPIDFPLVVLVVSGGHSDLLLMRGHGDFQRLGRTLDDAAGEAFDKVGRLLRLPYPGGPAIQKAGAEGDPAAFDFPRALMQPDKPEERYNFSFSGLKTAVLRSLQRLQPGYQPDDPLGSQTPVADLAASFQAAIIDVLVEKSARAANDFGAREVFVAGGVAANALLRREMPRRAGRPVRVPPLSLCTDNAAMIGAAAYFRLSRGQSSALDFDIRPNWPIA